MPFIQNVGVVVGQLLPRHDIGNGLDPDATVIDDGIAVGIAGVVDESRRISLHRSVDHHIVVYGEEKGVMSLTVDLGVTRLCLCRR